MVTFSAGDIFCGTVDSIQAVNAWKCLLPCLLRSLYHWAPPPARLLLRCFDLVCLVLLQECNHHNIHSRRAISLYTHALCKVACPCGGYETSANAVAHYSPCTYLVAAPFSAQLRIFLLLLRRLEEKKCVSIPCCKLPASLAIKMNT